MRKRTEVGFEKVLSTLKNIGRCGIKRGRWRRSSDFFKSDFAKMVLAKEEALSQLARAKQVLTELKTEVDKTSLDDLN